MSKFLKMIERNLYVLSEEELPPPPEEAPGADAEQPTAPPEESETPESELPGEDDTAKLKIDYVEMIRKALIMAPKHIDDVDYARLTKIVDAENLEEMQELVSRIVRNNYPHPDFEV